MQSGMMGFPNKQSRDMLDVEPDDSTPDPKDILAPAIADVQASVVAKRGPGRPTNAEKQKTDAGSSILKEMIKEYEDGASDEEVCRLLRLPIKEFEKKLKNDEQFKTLVTYGRLAAKAYWYKIGRSGTLKKGTYDFSFWAFNMKNRYGWAEKSETKEFDEKPISQKSTDELLEDLALMRGKLSNTPLMKSDAA